jgi:type IV pilus assembly protein PilM
LNDSAQYRHGIYGSAFVRRMARLLDAMPHPLVACEVSTHYVAAAHWKRGTFHLDDFAVAEIPAGSVKPSAVETNLLDAPAVRLAAETVFQQIGIKNQPIALFIPDEVIRVFVLHFDVFPRSSAEAIPMLRWRLKKSVPFEAEETLISYMRQAPRDDGVDIVTSLARLRIVREYEGLLESTGAQAGVVLSSTLATIPLLLDDRPTMLARLSGTTLTTVIAREGVLCGYRCTDLSAELDTLDPRVLLDELFPVAAYYQDAWSEGLHSVRLAGFAGRIEEFRAPLESELHCEVSGLLNAAQSDGRLTSDNQRLADRELDSLIGWSMNRGA